MKVATWNVNSVRARLPRVVSWLRAHQPDVLCLQETKVEDELFPREPLEDEGYNIETFGQRNYNGVAVLARHPIEAVVKGFPPDSDDGERRAMACRVRSCSILNLYVPNGQAVGHERYFFKLRWLERLRHYLDRAFDPAERLLVVGDFNVTFDDRDVWDPVRLREAIQCSTREREALARVLGFGLRDGLRLFQQGPGIYTWWHYRALAARLQRGLRLDHILLTDTAALACRSVSVDVAQRHGSGASDHVPVTAILAEAQRTPPRPRIAGRFPPVAS
jgi:exodeoxyribonuclease-3